MAGAQRNLELITKENEKTQSRLQESEKQNDEMEVKQESITKQSEIQRQQLNDKIRDLEQLLTTEKDTRELWINKFEMEQ